MLIFAGLTLAAAVAIITDPGLNNMLPDAQCLAVAQAIVTDLQPAADSLAGKPVTLKVVAGTPLFWTRFTGDSEEIPGEINIEGEIVIHQLFCVLEPWHKTAVMAHEIGHLIDFQADAKPLVSLLPQVFLPWRDRPMEKKANLYARQLFKMKGGDTAIFGPSWELGENPQLHDK